MLVVSLPNSRQNRLLPQALQNPRSAVVDERYKDSVAVDLSVSDADLALVIAA